jgi:hypothetical protein
MTAAENLVSGDLCYLNGSGQWAKADASAASTSRALALATATINAAASGDFLLHGFYRWSADQSYTVGGAVYLSETAGAVTQTAPVTTGSITQVIAVATASDTLYFKPSMDIVEHT